MKTKARTNNEGLYKNGVYLFCLTLLMLVLMICPTNIYSETDGWQQDEDGYWHYYENGERITGWKEIDGETYYFHDSGVMYSGGVHEIDGQEYRFDEDGHLLGAGGGWFSTEEIGKDGNTHIHRYYAEENGALAIGWKEIDGETYYFDKYVGMYSNGMYQIGEGIYYRFDEDGHLLSGPWICVDDPDGYSYVGGPGERKISWYYKEDGNVVTGWKKIDGNWHYFEENSGKMYAGGIYEINKKYYLFNYNGELQGVGGGWVEDTIYYSSLIRRSPGRYTYWYYAEPGGALSVGWKKIDGWWYYFGDESSRKDRPMGRDYAWSEPDRSRYASRVYEIEGKNYLFNWDGRMLGIDGGWIWYDIKDTDIYRDTDFHDPDTTGWYYSDKGGTLVTGWRKMNGTWYYFSEDSFDVGVMTANRSRIIDGRAYAFDENDAWLGEKGGWIKLIDNYGEIKWYYAEQGGVLATGWKKINNEWYYFSENSFDVGVMTANGSRFINGKHYLFNSSGALSKGGWVKVEYSWGDIRWYYANSDGTIKTGWVKDGNTWYYMHSSGAMAANEYVGGYWLNGNGSWTYPYKATWHKSGNRWWYGDASGWYAANKSYKIDGTVYNFDAAGWLE